MSEEFENYILPTEINKVIKVIGVGGGGSNAVNHMYQEGIHNVTFAVCNADIQDLNSSPVPVKLQIGEALTSGLGCGAKPEKGMKAALESEEKIKSLLSDGTKMVFITAGMGGGTGTGAAPVVARIAKEMGILTVGIVTIPFKFELGNRIKKALEGVAEMKKYVDALLIINNEKLIELYKNMTLDQAFYKADEVLSESAKSIAEMITLKGNIINIDFADVETILKDSGVAIMNTGMADGENRIKDAIDEALCSPLLKNRDIRQATRILMYVYTSEEHKLTMTEMGQISEFIQSINKDLDEELIWGGTIDNNLESSIKITIVATGFELSDLSAPEGAEELYEHFYNDKAAAEQKAVQQKITAQQTEETVVSEQAETEQSTTAAPGKQEDEAIPFSIWSNSSTDDFGDFNTPPAKR